MQMKVNKIILKLKKKIKLDSMKIGVAKITPVGTINIDENGTYDVTNYNEAIVEIPMPSGEIEITSNGTYDVTNFANAEVNCPSDLDWSAIGYNTRPQSIEEGYNYALQIQNEWTPNSQLSDYPNLLISPLVNTSAKTSLRMFAYNCSRLIEIPIFDTRNVTNMSAMFQNCTSLTSVPLFDTSKATNLSGMFQSCTLLTQESLNNILQMCINATSFTGTKTLKYLGLSSTQATTCQSLSNYQAFLNAGWTTGY